MTPPRAPRRPMTRTLHGDPVPDDFAWMRDVGAPELRSYLEAENDWTTRRTAHLSALRERVFDELAGVLPADDRSAPWRAGAYEYWTERRAGEQYDSHLRRPVDGDGGGGSAEVILDENALAAGQDYLALGVCAVSPDGRLLVYSVDHDGNEIFTMRVRDLATGHDLPDVIDGTYYELAWAADSASFFYTTVDAHMRAEDIRRHVVGTDPADDAVVWHEDDRRFDLWPTTTRSGELVLLVSENRDTSEVRMVPADDPAREPVMVHPRAAGVEYQVDHQAGPDGGRLLMLVDDAGPEFRLVSMAVADVDGTDRSASWREVVAHDADVRLKAVDAFAEHVVLTERHGGQQRLRILGRDDAVLRTVVPDESESVAVGTNEVYDAESLRVVRQGWVRPPADVDHRFADGSEMTVYAQGLARPTPSYRCELRQVTADDGVRIPMSLLRAADASGAAAGPAPCLLYAYGAYESVLDPEFWYLVWPLLDRGFVIAVAHLRGGGEGGRGWWQQGRLLNKRTTFTDFLACARELVASGVTTTERLVARGISAGGLMVGASLSMVPEQFAAVVAEVPFVDVISSMLDDTLPLTVNEWDEWGDPRDRATYDYMKGYSPYENIPRSQRPALLVTASVHDSRVSVHEPAKWVAKLRVIDDEEGGDRPELLLHTLIGSGAHAGPSGRYDAWRHEALLHAFVIDQVGSDQP